MKIIPCVEGDRSDCQPEASSNARSLRLREWWLSRVDKLIYHLQHTGHDCFYYTESQSFTQLVYLCILGLFVKRKEWSMSLYEAFAIIL